MDKPLDLKMSHDIRTNIKQDINKIRKNKNITEFYQTNKIVNDKNIINFGESTPKIFVQVIVISF